MRVFTSRYEHQHGDTKWWCGGGRAYRIHSVKVPSEHNTSCKRDHDIAAGRDLPASDGVRNEIEVAAQTLGLQLRTTTLLTRSRGDGK
jgi:hypothetical protein